MTFTAGAADPAKTTISAFPTSVSVDGTGSVITVQAKDQFGNNLPSGGDIVTLSSTHGSLTSVTDNTDGTYSATLTDTLAGTDTVSGTINAAAITSGDAHVTFTAGAADPAKTTISAFPTSVSVDGTGSVITVQAKDQFGNNLPSGGDIVTLSSTDGVAHERHRQHRRDLQRDPHRARPRPAPRRSPATTACRHAATPP